MPVDDCVPGDDVHRSRARVEEPLSRDHVLERGVHRKKRVEHVDVRIKTSSDHLGVDLDAFGRGGKAAGCLGEKRERESVGERGREEEGNEGEQRLTGMAPAAGEGADE